MYIFGGWQFTDGSTELFLNDLHIFDIQNLVWSNPQLFGIGPLPRCQTVCMPFIPAAQKSPIRSLISLPTCPGFIDKQTVCTGFLVFLGGASHYSDTEMLDGSYGSRVRDFDDFHVLDLATLTWVPMNYSNPALRGGVNAVVFSGFLGQWLFSGGMHSDAGSNMPVFRNDLVSIQPKFSIC